MALSDQIAALAAALGADRKSDRERLDALEASPGGSARHVHIAVAASANGTVDGSEPQVNVDSVTNDSTGEYTVTVSSGIALRVGTLLTAHPTLATNRLTRAHVSSATTITVNGYLSSGSFNNSGFHIDADLPLA